MVGMVSYGYNCLLFCCQLLLVQASSTPHEELLALPPGWRHIGCPPGDEIIQLHISLVQRNIELLQSLVDQISDPDSLCYGQYLEREEVDALFSPSQGSSDGVHSWLLEAGVSRRDIQVTTHGISISVSIDQANALFNTSFQNYRGPENIRTRTTRYHIPPRLKEHINHVSPTVYFGPSSWNLEVITSERLDRRSESGTTTSSMGNCQTFWTPSCLSEAYNVGSYQANESSGSSVAWGAFWNASARYRDLEEYEHIFGLPPRNFTVELVNDNAFDNQEASANAREHLNDLDAFTIAALTGGRVPMIQYSASGLAPGYLPNAVGPSPADNGIEPWLVLYEYLLRKPNSELPQVLTHSYSEDEQTVPRRYAERVCHSIGLLALRGISVIQTMGGAGPGTSCVSNDGLNTPQLTPQFPASCPYVTGVGEVNQTNPLITWNITSGGFSFYWDRPAYQDNAVQRYLEEGISKDAMKYYEPLINKHGRASPDLSLAGYKPDYQGDFFADPVVPSGGTRGNAAWAALVGLLNDARLSSGRPAMGFLNPWLYKRATLGGGLIDVVRGAAIGCVGRNIQFDRVIPDALVIPGIAWNATEGWDPATGLGFPDFQALLRSAMDDFPAKGGPCVLRGLDGKPIKRG